MDEQRLDGNAAAGTLGEVFSFEVTTAEYACDGCGRTGRLEEAMVYEARALGIVVRRSLRLVRQELRGGGEPVRGPLPDRAVRDPAARHLGDQEPLGPRPHLQGIAPWRCA